MAWEKVCGTWDSRLDGRGLRWRGANDSGSSSGSCSLSTPRFKQVVFLLVRAFACLIRFPANVAELATAPVTVYSSCISVFGISSWIGDRVMYVI